MLTLKDIGRYLISRHPEYFWLCKIDTIDKIEIDGSIGKAEGIRIHYNYKINWYTKDTSWWWNSDFIVADLGKFVSMFPEVKLDGYARDFVKGFLKELAQ